MSNAALLRGSGAWWSALGVGAVGILVGCSGGGTGTGGTGGTTTTSSSTTSHGGGGTGGMATGTGGTGGATTSSSATTGTGGMGTGGTGGAGQLPPDACAPGGDILWQTTLPRAGLMADSLQGAATGPAGDLVLGEVQHASVDEVVISRLDPTGATGAFIHAGIHGSSNVGALAVDAQGDTLFAFGYTPSSTSGAEIHDHASGGNTIFAAVGSWPTASGTGVALRNIGADAAGNVVANVSVTTQSPGSAGVDFGGGPEKGDRILRWNAAGMILPSLPSPAPVVLVGADGHLYTARSFTGSADAGCGPKTAPSGSGVLLAGLDAAGACQWSRVVDVKLSGSTTPLLKLGADGSLLVALPYTGTMSFGDATRTAAGVGLAIARLDSAGNVLFSRGFAGDASTTISAPQIDGNASGAVFVAAHFTGAPDLGCGPLSGGDTFVTALTPQGGLRWTKVVQVGSSPIPPQTSLFIAQHPSGLVLVTNSTTVDPGMGPISTSHGFPPSVVNDLGVVALAY